MNGQVPGRLLLLPVLVSVLAPMPAAAQPAATVVEPLPDAVWAAMQGVSWHAGRGCPARDELVLLTVPFRDFAGLERTGRLVVARRQAGEVATALDAIFSEGTFRIERMELIEVFGGDDDASMAANNTSAFNCRYVGDTKTLSTHALGIAIDINPVQNPYVPRSGAQPAAGEAYDESHERTEGVTGIILPGDAVTRAFGAVGWTWGGDWKTKKDFQHFSQNGR